MWSLASTISNPVYLLSKSPIHACLVWGSLTRLSHLSCGHHMPVRCLSDRLSCLRVFPQPPCCNLSHPCPYPGKLGSRPLHGSSRLNLACVPPRKLAADLPYFVRPIEQLVVCPWLTPDAFFQTITVPWQSGLMSCRHVHPPMPCIQPRMIVGQFPACPLMSTPAIACHRPMVGIVLYLSIDPQQSSNGRSMQFHFSGLLVLFRNKCSLSLIFIHLLITLMILSQASPTRVPGPDVGVHPG